MYALTVFGASLGSTMSTSHQARYFSKRWRVFFDGEWPLARPVELLDA
jgi:hypothetical protein